MTDDERARPADDRPDLEERTAELVAGALADDLDERERAELAAIVAADPTVGAELEELGGTVARLRREVTTWREEAPSPRLRASVLGHGEPDAGPVDDPPPILAPATATAPVRRRSARRRSFWIPAASFAGGVLVAAGGATVASGLQDAPPQGPPGTLGVVEDVTLDAGSDGPAGLDGARIDAALVAHTWGTETVLEIEGLPAGEGFDVVLVGADGQEFDSGSFLGSAVTIDCRMNAAVMRADVARLEIRQDDGVLVTAATLPDAVDDRG